MIVDLKEMKAKSFPLEEEESMDRDIGPRLTHLSWSVNDRFLAVAYFGKLIRILDFTQQKVCFSVLVL